MFAVWPFLLDILFITSAFAADFSGSIVAVLDTIDVLHNAHPERIRLSGIACPEKGQAYGMRAKQAASALVFGKEVTLQMHGHDRAGRTIPCQCASARWDPRQSHAGQKRLLLVVSKIRA